MLAYWQFFMQQLHHACGQAPCVLLAFATSSRRHVRTKRQQHSAVRTARVSILVQDSE
jgi:hypothetical protein